MFSAFSAAVAAEGCTSLIKFDKEILYCSFIREVITHYPADWARKLNSRFFSRPLWKHFRDQTFQKRYRNLCFEKYPETETKLSETETETKFSETSKNWKKCRNQEVSRPKCYTLLSRLDWNDPGKRRCQFTSGWRCWWCFFWQHYNRLETY